MHAILYDAYIEGVKHTMYIARAESYKNTLV